MVFKFFHKGKNVLFAWIACLAFGMFLFQFGSYPKLKIASGNTDLPEEQFGFSAEYFYQFLNLIDETGRAIYFNFQLFDYLNAALLGIALFGTLCYFLNRITDNKLATVILTFPLLAAVFDVSENSLILYALSQFPEKVESAVHFANIFTKLKLSAGSLSGLLVICCGLIVLLKFVVAKVRA